MLSRKFSGLMRPMRRSQQQHQMRFLLSTLAFVEHSAGKPSAGALSALSAAKSLGQDITALIAGSDAKTVAEQVASVDGVSKVLVASNGNYDKQRPENLATLLVANIKEEGSTHVVGAGSAVGKDVLPRVAALLDVQPIADVVKVVSNDTFVRPIYAGNALLTVKSASDPVKIITVRSSAFDKAVSGGSAAPIEDAKDPDDEALSQWVSEELAESERPDLGTANRVVSGGRGVKDKQGFEKVIFPLADSLGAAIGASRAAVDAGFADNSLQVGQTGKVVAPDLYVAVGISGAIQHLAGMKDSKTIVAVNKDPEAPIFQVADVGLVADLFEAVPELTAKINNSK